MAKAKKTTTSGRRVARNQPKAAKTGQATLPGAEEHGMIDPKKIIPIPDGINKGLSSAKRSTMISILGMPRDTFDNKCRGVTNAQLAARIVTEDVGPFKVTGFQPAVASLRGVMAEVKAAHPEVHEVIGSSGMLCARLIGGSDKPSNHSWGCALDINIEGALDGISVGGGTGRKDDKTLAGLAAMAPFFNAAGWYWGVGFSNFEDGMHFEIADETIRAWHADGTLGDGFSGRSVAAPNMQIGDRGLEVRRLQEALAALGFDIIPDGDFGPITHGIVIDFQASRGLVPDGIVGAKTKKALGLS